MRDETGQAFGLIFQKIVHDFSAISDYRLFAIDFGCPLSSAIANGCQQKKAGPRKGVGL